MTELALFPELVQDECPRTQGIKYAGSKRSLIPHILRAIEVLQPRSVLDGFSGSTRVSQALAASGYTVRSNDSAVWSQVFATCYLLSSRPPEYYKPLIEHLNALPGEDGWFTEHYGGDPRTTLRTSPKRPWQAHNTRKLDAIREEIERLNLSTIEKAVAITSLILALDKVDSTLGHFASYLRDWSPRSYQTMKLDVPQLIQKQLDHTVYASDIFSIVDSVEADVAYLDPPYGSNNDKMPPSRIRYQAYYHVWKSICLYDKPSLFGRVGRRLDSSDAVAASPFEDFRKTESGRFIAVEAIERVLKRVRARFVVLSYSSGGRSTAQELHEIIHSVGRLRSAVELDHKRHVMAGMRWTNQWIKDCETPNREFLFTIEK